MKLKRHTAAGIDISQQRISIVLLESGENGPVLLKSASVKTPEGAVENGNIRDAALLARTIRDLRRRSGIRARHAAATLFARPAVVQILDMPKEAPTNVRQFVNSEIKNCVVLPSRDVAIDFCGIGSVRRTADKRVLAVAAENERMVELVRVCGTAGLRVEIIEPALLAYLRAIHGQKISGKTGCNVLVAILQGTTLTLCVLRNGLVDFIRTKEIAKTSDDLSHRLADELSDVARFYDVDVPENTGKWEITVFVSDSQQAVVEELIKSRIQAEHLQVRRVEDAYMDTPVSGSSAITDEKPSPVAVGLAMNLLTRHGIGVVAKLPDLWRINLLPPQITRIREAKRDVLVAANTVAAVLLIMVLTINIFALLIARATRGSLAKEQLVGKQDTSVLLEQQWLLDRRLGALTARLDGIQKIQATQKDVNWAMLFDEIRKITPGTVRITAMSCQDGSKMLIQGLALSDEAVYSFVNLLEKSPGIASVALLETREGYQKGIITYQLMCKLTIRSDKADDVS
jgi:type IV pilus assembly protein PilM